MKAFDDAIERGLALLSELLHRDAAAAREFQDSLGAFVGPAAGPDAALTPRRRHLEWFLLERPCEALGDVPLPACLDAWREAAPPEVLDLQEALSGSYASAFEVTSLDAAGTIWTRDLFGLGELPLIEPAAAKHLQEGDLVVGRVFPIGDGSFRVSVAAGTYRDLGLVEALRRDLERMRATRRGSLRVQQIELEKLFFGAGGGAAVPSKSSAEARAELVDAGLSPALASEIVDTLEGVSDDQRSGTVTEALNHLAFETEVDLERARRTLVELAGGLREGDAPSVGAAAGEGSREGSREGTREGTGAPADEVSEGSSADAAEVAAALSRFDQARAEGGDLEVIFRELETELGLEVEAPSDDEVAPDFPGVVGAVVGEYLWDVGREDPARAGRATVLHALSRYGAEIGVFEDLGERDLLDFAARWILDQEPEAAARVVKELGPFARWVEEQHAHALWTDAGPALDAVAADLPRILRARAALEGAPRGEEPWWAVERVDAHELGLITLDGRERRRVAAPDGGELRAGDLVRVDEERLVAIYPAALRRLIVNPTDG